MQAILLSSLLLLASFLPPSARRARARAMADDFYCWAKCKVYNTVQFGKNVDLYS